MKNYIKKADGMLLATLLTTIFYSATYPYIHQIIISEADSNLIAFQQIINCISIILFGSLWNKKGDKLFKYYPVLCIIETILGIFTTMFAILTSMVAIYYMLDTFVFAIITRNIICGGIKLRSLRYVTSELREQFDNNNNSMGSVGTIIGSIIAIFLKLDFNAMLIIATFGNAIDNIFYVCIFLKLKKQKGR